ncbi:hypothetical protein NKDENANG_00504 [Candidatus Entotheonellaceae bacterium PAL068K]
MRRLHEHRCYQGDWYDWNNRPHRDHQLLPELFHLRETLLPGQGVQVKRTLRQVDRHGDRCTNGYTGIAQTVPAILQHQAEVVPEETERGGHGGDGAPLLYFGRLGPGAGSGPRVYGHN